MSSAPTGTTRIAYVDTSFLLAITLGEAKGPEAAAQLASFDRVYSDNLLEAEFRAALAREGVGQDQDRLLTGVTWLYPDEALSEEYRAGLGRGLLRGADLRHLACALYLERHVGPIEFLSLDARQRQVAVDLGLRTSP